MSEVKLTTWEPEAPMLGGPGHDPTTPSHPHGLGDTPLHTHSCTCTGPGSRWPGGSLAGPAWSQTGPPPWLFQAGPSPGFSQPGFEPGLAHAWEFPELCGPRSQAHSPLSGWPNTWAELLSPGWSLGQALSRAGLWLGGHRRLALPCKSSKQSPRRGQPGPSQE